MAELVSIVREQAAVTNHLLDQILLYQPQSAHYTQLLSFLKRLCKQVTIEIESIPSLEASLGSPNPAFELAQHQLLIFYSQALKEIHNYCENFDHSDCLVIPNSMMQLLNKLALGIGQTRPFILRGILLFNYQYNPVGKALNRLASGISDTGQPLDNSFSTFNFPLANGADILSNCNLGHEFGHLMVDSLNLIQRVGTALQPEMVDNIQNIANRHAIVGNQADFEIIDRINRIITILGNWIHESIADLIGLYLLGPAHIFAFLNFIQTFSGHGADDDEHPCDAFRIDLMVSEAIRLGWQDLFEKETPLVWDQIQRMRSTTRTTGEYSYNAAADCIAEIRQVMCDVAMNICGVVIYKPATLDSAKGKMIDLLCRGVPPVEYLDTGTGKFDQFDAVTILNVGWLFYEKGVPTWTDRFKQYDSVQRKQLLNRLLTKAIDISFVCEAANLIDR